MSPLRIGLVAEDYYPQLGGVPEHVHHLARELDSLGHNTTIVTSHMRNEGPDPAYVRRVGTSVVIYANGGVARLTVGWRLTARLAALFRGGARHERPKLLWLGRIEPRNDLATVLAAMPRILERHPGAKLTVVGDGPWRARMERAARPFGPSVEFAGYANGSRPGYYRSSDVYLCPTTRASFGVTLLEAMACGTPLVVSDIPAFRDVAAESGAVFVPPRDPEAWGKHVNDLIENPEQREGMMALGRAVAERHAWPLISQRVLDVYKRVLA